MDPNVQTSWVRFTAWGALIRSLTAEQAISSIQIQSALVTNPP